MGTLSSGSNLAVWPIRSFPPENPSPFGDSLIGGSLLLNGACDLSSSFTCGRLCHADFFAITTYNLQVFRSGHHFGI